jgi:phage N-6-adenine-methyltransferase
MGEGKAKGFTHDSVDNKTVDWYTPQWVFDALDLKFDLDPCAPKGGVPWIPAAQHYSLPDDGLKEPWHGRIWLNPPYGTQTKKWLKRLDEHGNGVALVFARTDCQWFHQHVVNASAILLLSGRISFVDGLGKTSTNGAGAGSMLIAWGGSNALALFRMRDKGLFIDLDTNRAATVLRGGQC